MRVEAVLHGLELGVRKSKSSLLHSLYIEELGILWGYEE